MFNEKEKEEVSEEKMNGKNLSHWEVKEKDFPKAGTIEKELTFLLRYAHLAPSGHNTQPWNFSIRGNKISVYEDLARNLPVVDPDNREMYISAGCALANLLIAAEHFHFGYKLDFFPEGKEDELVAVAEFFAEELEQSEFPENLFASITQRHTNRNEYETRTINEESLQKLKECADEEGIRLDLIKEPQVKSEVAELIARGDVILMNNKAFRRELASWIRHNWTKSGDGMPCYAFGIPGAISFLGPFFIKSCNMSKSQSEKDRRFADQTPVLGILSSAKDDKLSCVKTGILFEKIALTATKIGILYAFLNQPIELPELRQELKSLLKLEELPQLLFRLGYAKLRRHTPRRPIQEVLVP